MDTAEAAIDTATRASDATSEFVDRAAAAETAKEAADWALAARNMASTLHSLIGAAAHIPRRRP